MSLASTLGGIWNGITAAPQMIGNQIAYPIIEAQNRDALNKGQINAQQYQQLTDQAGHNANFNLGDAAGTLFRKVASPIAQTAVGYLTAGMMPEFNEGSALLNAIQGAKLGAAGGGLNGVLQALGSSNAPKFTDFTKAGFDGALYGGAAGGLGAGLLGSKGILGQGMQRLVGGNIEPLANVLDHPALSNPDLQDTRVMLNSELPGYGHAFDAQNNIIHLNPSYQGDMHSGLLEQVSNALVGKDTMPINANGQFYGDIMSPQNLQYGSARDQIMSNPRIDDKASAIRDLADQFK